jgi:thiamine transporter ThiT
MTGRRALRAVIALAIVSALAIVALLLTEGALDWLLLCFAALPLLVGCWRWRAEAGKSGKLHS